MLSRIAAPKLSGPPDASWPSSNTITILSDYGGRQDRREGRGELQGAPPQTNPAGACASHRGRGRAAADEVDITERVDDVEPRRARTAMRSQRAGTTAPGLPDVVAAGCAVAA